ncbi:MAG: isochorismatase family cysteine hydrolase [Candidatus Hodarchaeaceae archaeon]|nr:isochorismatase family cysteine hydrolase [Candidatus Hodarchaeaceae archaeon]
MGVAVLVIDMINDFVSGMLKSSRAKGVVPNIQKLLEFARSRKIPVVYTCDSHQSTDAEFELWGPHAIAGSRGAEVVSELKPKKGDHIVKKGKYSAFFGTDLDQLLRDLDVTRLVLVGVSTDVCVQNTAADAFYRGYEIVVPRDCVDAFTEEGHRRALEYMGKVYGAKVTTSDELIKNLRREHAVIPCSF